MKVSATNASSTTPIIEVEQLACGYDRKQVISGIDFSLPSGCLSSIIGPNGSGKSTCFKTLTGLIPPLSGSIKIAGRELQSYKLRERAQTIAMVNQLIAPLPLTVYEYVLMGRMPYFRPMQFGYTSEDHEIAAGYIELTGISELKDRRLDELSGGEQQMAAIAQALTQQPRLLLLDEPTSHLDIGYATRIMQLLERLHRESQLSVLMILHDLNIASEYCDELLLFSGGRVLAQGTPETVVTAEHVEEAYHFAVAVHTSPYSHKPYVYPLHHRDRES